MTNRLESTRQESMQAIMMAAEDVRSCVLGLCPDNTERSLALDCLEMLCRCADTSLRSTGEALFSLDEGLDPDIYAPNRAHDTDAGADLSTTEDVVVPAHGSAEIHTGVHVELPHGYCGLLVSKSGLNVVNCVTSTGLIDEGFSGEIRVRVYNHGDRDWYFLAGDEVTQIVLIPVLYAKWVRASRVTGGERGDNGYGSTGGYGSAEGVR